MSGPETTPVGQQWVDDYSDDGPSSRSTKQTGWYGVGFCWDAGEGVLQGAFFWTGTAWQGDAADLPVMKSTLMPFSSEAEAEAWIGENDVEGPIVAQGMERSCPGNTGYRDMRDDSADHEAFLAVLQYRAPNDPEGHAAGLAARLAGIDVHDGPKQRHTAYALSWRRGWDRPTLDNAFGTFVRQVYP